LQTWLLVQCMELEFNPRKPLRTRGITVVIIGRVGRNAFQALSLVGIKVLANSFGKIRRAVERYKKSGLTETGGSTVSGHFGMGRGRGRQ
jgi:predicted Fe-Mo cluster-binding NifX family protein